jgi:hypothetical protein
MTKSKNRKIADLISTGSAFSDGSVAASEVTGLGTAATTAATDYATAGQGTLAASALQPSGDGSGLSGILLPNGSGANLTNLPISPSVNNISTEAFGSSGTFTAKTAGTYIIQLVGGGGSGAYGAHQTANGKVSISTGGSGGGYSRLKVAMDVGDTLAIVIGGSGAAPSGQITGSSSSAVVKQGNAGGNSTCQGSNIGAGNVTVNMAANGGGGGNAQAYTVGGSTALSLDSDAGGTASGGDINYTGGQSKASGNTGYTSGLTQEPASFSLYSNGSGDQVGLQSHGINIGSVGNANAGEYPASLLLYQIKEIVAMPFSEGGINGVQPFIANSIYASGQNKEYRTMQGGRGCGGGSGYCYYGNSYMYGSSGGQGFCYVTLFGTL